MFKFTGNPANRDWHTFEGASVCSVFAKPSKAGNGRTTVPRLFCMLPENVDVGEKGGDSLLDVSHANTGSDAESPGGERLGVSGWDVLFLNALEDEALLRWPGVHRLCACGQEGLSLNCGEEEALLWLPGDLF